MEQERVLVEERRREDERPDWEWSADLRDAFHEAVTTILDRNAILVAQVPAAARPAPRRAISPGS